MQYYVEEGKLQENFFALGKVKAVINKYNLSRTYGATKANYRPSDDFLVNVYLRRGPKSNGLPRFNKEAAVSSDPSCCTFHCLPHKASQ
jgi:hypothetical protein